VLQHDPKVKAVFDAFVDEMTSTVEPTISARNNDPNNVSRCREKSGMPYTLLYPTSKAGVTMQGVPYSISI
jgi:hypothetical protein